MASELGPNVELAIARNKEGDITNLAYTVHHQDPSGKRAIEFTEIVKAVLGEPEVALNISVAKVVTNDN